MARRFPAIEGAIREFIEAQKMFFVGSAPRENSTASGPARDQNLPTRKEPAKPRWATRPVELGGTHSVLLAPQAFSTI
jgi:hypothetical protein